MRMQKDRPAVASRTFPAHPSALFPVRQFVRGRAADVTLSLAATDDLVLAVSEACANCLHHTSSREFTLRWRALPDRVEVEVADGGVFLEPIPLQDAGAEAGRGIALMMAVIDEVEFRKGTSRRPGTVVRLVKYRRD
jgi:anti-sigma regulatory factor (Ser/Thr protein kinase)